MVEHTTMNATSTITTVLVLLVLHFRLQSIAVHYDAIYNAWSPDLLMGANTFEG